jgi:ABC-type glycerol-3-phosphate transport system substrate-binding protein
MRRVFLIVLLALVAFGLSAQKITLLHEGDVAYEGLQWPTAFQRGVQIIEAKYPGVKVELIDASGGIQGGINAMLEALVASGQTPNVIDMTIMRLSKFFKPGQALDLKQYGADKLKKWEPQFLARVTKDGKVYAVTGTTWGLALGINLDLAAEVGWKAPEPTSAWSMDSFMEFAKLIKAKAPGKYATVLFSGSNPIPYVTCWWASFGVEFFKNGDYSKVTIDSPQTRKALAWMRMMIDEGYVPPNASQIIDDDSVAMSAAGNIGVNLWNPSPPAKSAWYPFPKVAGVKQGGTFQNYTAVCAIDKKDKKINQVSAELALTIVDDFYQNYSAGNVNDKVNPATPTMLGIAVRKTESNAYQVADIIKKFGIYDMGSEGSKYPAFRPVIRPFLSQFFDGVIDAETFIKKYEAAANEALQ